MSVLKKKKLKLVLKKRKADDSEDDMGAADDRPGEKVADFYPMVEDSEFSSYIVRVSLVFILFLFA